MSFTMNVYGNIFRTIQLSPIIHKVTPLTYNMKNLRHNIWFKMTCCIINEIEFRCLFQQSQFAPSYVMSIILLLDTKAWIRLMQISCNNIGGKIFIQMLRSLLSHVKFVMCQILLFLNHHIFTQHKKHQVHCEFLLLI